MKGFTLIEILIALTVFALVSTMTASTLYYTFQIWTRVTKESERLQALELAISIFQQDSLQTIERAIRGNDMRLLPTFIGKSHYLEFTRDGIANPNSIEKRSTLKRVAYVCRKDKLVRRTWPALDVLDRRRYNEKIVIDQLTGCHFKYLSQSLQFLKIWRDRPVTPNQRKELLPQAIQMTLHVPGLGAMTRLFVIPGALYGSG